MRSPNNPKLAAALLAALVCASCVTTTPQGPPWALMEDCFVPQARLSTNGDLVPHIRALRSALRSCNDDKKALRDWAEKQ